MPATTPTVADQGHPDGSDGSLKVEWTQTTLPRATSLQVQHRVSTTTNWSNSYNCGTFSKSGDTYTCIITGLNNGTSYQVRVRANNPNGYGPWSAASAAATPDDDTS